jgi:hypothetical protein
MEYQFSVFIYPLDDAQAEALRAEIEALILEKVEAAGKFMGPLLAEVNQERWIPVGERLPEETSWVLVYQDGAVNCMAYEPGKGFADWVQSPAFNIVPELITHWQPLPEPPTKEGGDGQEG